MTAVSATALRAENDQLRSALREALRLSDPNGLGVVCESCGAKVGRSCYGNGPMAESHESRSRVAVNRVREILLNVPRAI